MILRLILGLAVGVVLVALSIKQRLLTPFAAVLAFALLLDILLLGGYAPAVYIIVVFLLSGVIGSLAAPKKKKGKGEARGIFQVAANGAVAGGCLLLYGILNSLPLLIAYYAAVTEFFTDTLASDIGVHAEGQPLDLARMRRTERGRSGGVSLLGTGASAIGSLVCLLLSMGAGLSLGAAAIVALSAMIGMLLDSILGSLLQAKYTCRACGAYTEKPMHCSMKAEKTEGLSWMTNSTVNLVANLLSAVIAALLALML